MENNPIAGMKPAPHDECLCRSGIQFGDCCGPTAPSTHPREIVITPNAISDKRCNELVKYLKKQPKEWLKVAVQQSSLGGTKLVDDPGRVTQSVKQGKWQTKIIKWVRQGFVDNLAEHTPHTLQWFERPDLLYYSTGGTYNTHADSENYHEVKKAWEKLSDRDYSLLIYLADDFEGGDITFNLFDFTYHPKKGDMVFFPSDHRYMHTAMPVTAGHRFAIVSWCAVNEVAKVTLKAPANAIQEDV